MLIELATCDGHVLSLGRPASAPGAFPASARALGPLRSAVARRAPARLATASLLPPPPPPPRPVTL
eukprot:4230180-Prymnesium_polylepis.1